MIADGSEPITDDELLYRRIPVSQNWYDRAIDEKPSPLAFRPTQFDTTGLSLSRSKYKTIEEAARGAQGKQFFVGVVRCGDLRAVGIEVKPDPKVDDPGHCEIRGLTYATRKTDLSVEWQTLLARELCLRVEGPFQS
jgi:hypothetical protein